MTEIAQNRRFTWGKYLLFALICLTFAFLLATCSDPPVEPEKNLPEIIEFFGLPAKVLITDSTQLIWSTRFTDSLVIFPSEITVFGDTGRITIVPDSTSSFTAIAYNQFGQDTAVTSVSVQVLPFRIKPVNGAYYLGQMSSQLLNKPLEFILSDSAGRTFSDSIVHFELVAGDGVLLADSAMTNADGKVSLAYDFAGLLGHAVIRALYRDIDSTDLFLRANTLIPGNSGQAQYVLFDDLFIDIKNFNGQPSSIDTLGESLFVVIANYEKELGISFLMYDVDFDGLIDDSAHVHGAVVVDSVFLQPPDYLTVNKRYEGKTAESIGIGSTFREMNLVFGPYVGFPYEPDTLLPAFRTTYPDFNLEVLFDTLKVSLPGEPADYKSFQILMTEDVDTALFFSADRSTGHLMQALRSYIHNRR